MPDSRIDDLRRRVEQDPASIAFAQLAEEYRRAGWLEESIQTCRTGLARHPDYHSARVTLGRALAQLDRLDEAQTEFQRVLHGAPENLAAIRGMADIHHKRGSLPEAVTQYEAALTLAPNDPKLERTIDDLSDTLARTLQDADRDRALRTVAALEQWSAALHVTRAQRRP